MPYNPGIPGGGAGLRDLPRAIWRSNYIAQDWETGTPASPLTLNLGATVEADATYFENYASNPNYIKRLLVPGWYHFSYHLAAEMLTNPGVAVTTWGAEVYLATHPTGPTRVGAWGLCTSRRALQPLERMTLEQSTSIRGVYVAAISQIALVVYRCDVGGTATTRVIAGTDAQDNSFLQVIYLGES